MQVDPYEFDLLRALVREILEHPRGRRWKSRGFGRLLRLALDDGRVFLHVWNPGREAEPVTRGGALTFPVPGGLSPFGLHTHPWAMRSTVVAGGITQFLYRPPAEGETGVRYMRQRTVGGVGGHGRHDGDPEPVELVETADVYPAGTVYEQGIDEVHRTLPEPGTVTLVEQIAVGEEDAPRVYLYREGTPAVRSVADVPLSDAVVDEFALLALSRLL